MKNIDVNEIYILFEEIRELVKSGSKNSNPIQPEIELSDLSAITELSGKLDETIGEIRKPVRTEHHHIFSIASGKVFFGVITICTALLISLFVIYDQRKEIFTYRDNNLKYRYIQMQGEITPAGLINLDSIFENRRDSVKKICQQVEQYEEAVIEKAKRLERARLKEQETGRLREETDKLCFISIPNQEI